MEMTWYYAHDGARKGPVSRDDLQVALTRGEVDRQSLVWCQGMPQWQALESVEELQPLLAHVPPPLPPEPPPLPTQAAATPTAAADDGRSATDHRRPGMGGRILAVFGKIMGVFGRAIEWLTKEIVKAKLNSLFSRQGVTVVVVFCIAGGAAYSTLHPEPEPQPLEVTGQHPEATGQLRIDANPWGRIAWIRGPGGDKIDLPGAATTPFLMALPAGNYQVQVDYPHAQSSQRCELRVEPDRLATCWLDLAPVNAKSYFEKIGW